MMQYFDKQLKDFKKLPQEIVYEIFRCIPEYGHRVNKYLHAASIGDPVVSAYCDFRRYCARVSCSHLDIAIMAYGEDNKDIVAGSKKYLVENIQDTLIKYLRDREEEDCWTLEIIVEDLCDRNTGHLTRIAKYDVFDNEIYQCPEYYEHVLWLYSLMIAYDCKFITAEEFERRRIERYSKHSEFITVIELMLALFKKDDDIFNATIKCFPRYMEEVMRRLQDRYAVKKGIINDDVYYNNSDVIRKKMMERK